MADEKKRKNRWKKLRLIFDHDVERKGKHIVIKFFIKHGTNKTEHKLFIDPEDYPED